MTFRSIGKNVMDTHILAKLLPVDVYALAHCQCWAGWRARRLLKPHETWCGYFMSDVIVNDRIERIRWFLEVKGPMIIPIHFLIAMRRSSYSVEIVKLLKKFSVTRIPYDEILDFAIEVGDEELVRESFLFAGAPRHAETLAKMHSRFNILELIVKMRGR